MTRQRFLFIGLGLLTLWRWALLPTLELAPEEAHALLRVKHGWPEWVDGGGVLVGWLARVGVWIWGENEFGVRFFAPLLALLASLAVWRLARGLFDPMVAGWAVVTLNVLPAFNLAAVTLTSGSLLMFFTAGLLFFLRVALLHSHPLHWGWWAAGGCVAGGAFAAPPGLGLLLGVIAAMGWPRRLRHHLRFPGFGIITALWCVPVTLWLLAQGRNGWPVLEAGRFFPVLSVVPNLLRWVVLGSPLFLMLLVMLAWRVAPQMGLAGMRALPLGCLVPMAVLDLLFGPRVAWPDTGGAAWMVAAAVVLAHQAAVYGAVPTEQKISMRTTALVLAGVQSVMLLRSDLPRTLGLGWRFEPRTSTHMEWTHFFRADPSACMHGWRQSAALVGAALEKAPDRFVIASNWRLAAVLEYYLPSHAAAFQPAVAYPRIHAPQDGGWGQPYAFYPRYDASLDGGSPFRGKDALYITDDPAAVQPPAEVARHFTSVEILSVARVMHADNEVRWLKIFSCHDYRAPDL